MAKLLILELPVAAHDNFACILGWLEKLALYVNRFVRD